MSSTSRARLTKLRETTLGVLPTPAAMTQIRRTGGSWRDANTRNPSAEKRPDLMYVDAPRENYEVTGTIEDEWAYGAHDSEIEEALNNLKTAAINLTGLTLTAAVADNSLTRSAGNWTSDGILPGGVYNFAGLVQTLGRLRVVSVESATKIIVAGVTLSDEGPVGSCTVTNSGHNRMGTSLISSVFEEQFPDVGATELWQMLGCVCTGWQWQFSHPGKMTTTFNYRAISRAYNASTAGNGTVNAYAANRAMNSIDHFKAFREGGVLVGTNLRVKDLSFNIQAEKRVIDAAGTLGPVSFGLNSFNVTGSLRIYNSANARTLGMKSRNDTVTSLSWETQDPDGNVEHHFLPRVQLNEGSPQDGPKDGDVYVTMPFVASLDTTVGSIYQRTLFPAS